MKKGEMKMAVQTLMRQERRDQAVPEIFITYRTSQEGTLEERIWLTWLLKLHEDNQWQVEWSTLKRQYPDEAKEILRVFTTWQVAERRVRIFAERRQQDKEERIQQYAQAVCKTSTTRRSLEEFLNTLVRIQDDTKELDKVPSNRQIEEYAEQFGTPWPHSYQRRLYERDNWPRYMRMYRRAMVSSEEEKIAILAQIEEELQRKKQDRLKKRAYKMHKEVKAGRTRDELVKQLRLAQEHLGLGKYELPTQKQLTQCCREIGTPTYSSLFQRLGPHETWIELLKSYDEQLEIEDFMQRYQNLQLQKVWDLDELLARIQEKATPGELALMMALINKIQQTKQKGANGLVVKIKGQEYKLTVTRN